MALLKAPKLCFDILIAAFQRLISYQDIKAILFEKYFIS